MNGTAIPGANSEHFVAQESGTYWAVLTDSFGCSAQSDPLTLDLYDGFGTINGNVWVDLNNNGIVDASDTLIYGIPLQLLGNGGITGTAQSGVAGDFMFQNILSTDYTVIIDPSMLDPQWQIVVGQKQLTLSGCNALADCDLLIKSNCIASTGALQFTTCTGTPVYYNGTQLAAGETQTFHFNSSSGCDSVITVSVNGLPVSDHTIDVSICAGTTFDYNGTSIAAGQTKSFNFQNVFGCDSLVTVQVGALPVDAITLNVAVCTGSVFDYNGTLIPAGQAQNFIFQNSSGCDSFVTVQVNALPVSTGILNAAVCEGEVFEYHGAFIHLGETSSVVLQNTYGFDSIMTISVSLLEHSFHSFEKGICLGNSYEFNGISIQAGETQSFVFPNIAGCDSIVTITVFAVDTTASTLEVFVCPGAFYEFNGTLIPGGETRTFHFTGYEGCDSNITLIVSYFPEASFDLALENSCASFASGSLEVLNSAGGSRPYRYALNGGSLQAGPVFEPLDAGHYEVLVEDGNGCQYRENFDIEAFTPLTLILPDPVIPCDKDEILLEPVVTGHMLGLTYEWWNGAQTPASSASEEGPIWLEVSNACETVRQEAMVHWAGYDAGTSFVYVPNIFAPDADDYNNTIFKPFFAAGINLISYKLSVYDRWGNLVFLNTPAEPGWTGEFRVQDMNPGVYVWLLDAQIGFCGRVVKIRRYGDVTVVR